MSSNSKIAWTDATWNPVVGCSKVSPGCKHCYAINHVHRMAGNPNPKIAAANEGLTVIEGGYPNWTGKVRLIPERLSIPMKRRKPTRYFVNSLSDLFHKELPDEDIDKVVSVMALCPRHTFQILTKRSERMINYWCAAECTLRNAEVSAAAKTLSTSIRPFALPSERIFETRRIALGEAWKIYAWPLPNVWLGVSVESRKYLSRIDHLRQTPAAVRFLSLEPLLEDLGQLDLTGIDWVIVGGESGPGARPMHPDWVRSIRDQSVAAGVPFFFKQWGAYCPFPIIDDKKRDNFVDVPVGDATHHRMFRVRKKWATCLLDGRTWDEMPSGHSVTRRPWQ